MKNQRIVLLTIKSLLDDRLFLKLEKIFNYLDPNDLDFMASIEKEDYFKVILTFETEKQTILEEKLNQYDLLVSSEDITYSVLSFKYPEDLQDIISDNYYNKEIVDNFILNNLDIDKILDKINETGIESLNKIENRFLNQKFNI
jgi:galactitol-specific phosphotransferase system IIB component